MVEVLVPRECSHFGEKKIAFYFQTDKECLETIVLMKASGYDYYPPQEDDDRIIPGYFISK